MAEPALPSLADPLVQSDPDRWHASLPASGLWRDPQLGFWICSSYPLLRDIVRNPAVFSSVGSQTMDGLRPPPPEVLALRRQLLPAVNTMVTNDPPDHTRIRAALDAPFRPRAIAALRPSIRALVDACIGEFIAAGTCEFVQAFAIPIPVRVIARMLGLPDDLAPRIKAWSDAAVEPLGMLASDERLVECTRLTLDFQQYFLAGLAARRARPRADLLTHLVEVRLDDGSPFSDAQLLSICSQLLVAGNETTTNGLAAGMRRRAADPDLQQRLRAEPARIATFVEEVLRLDAPVQGLFRVVRRDVELGGQQLRAGERVMLRFAAANRDEAQFAAATGLDVARANAATHVAFGAGIHHCLGAGLAREEMQVGFARLLAATRSIALHPDNRFDHHPSMILRGLKSLLLTFEPAA